MALVQLPPLQIIQGQDAYFWAVFMEGSTPVDLTGWTGEVKLAREIDGHDFWSAPVQLDAEGNVSVTLPASETDAFCVRGHKIGSETVGVFQITLTAPVSEFNEIWQGNVAIARVIL